MSAPRLPRAEPNVPGGVIDLDNAATTRLRPEALAAMLPFLGARHGNPSGSHSVSRSARLALDEARERFAAAVGARPAEIVLTSGGTEADNLAVTGALAAARRRGVPDPVVACSGVEHAAVRAPVEAAGGTRLPVGAEGVVDLAALEEFLEANGGDRLVVISVMLVNNETGVIQPLSAVCELVRRLSPESLVHCDAVQGLCWLEVAEHCAAADLVSFSAHKFGGPQGVGALLVREEARGRLSPLLLGGPQERELRGGTHNVAGSVGMSVAAEMTASEREAAVRRVGELAERFVGMVAAGPARCVETVPRDLRVGAICNLRVPGVPAEEMLFALDELGVCASAGSACASGALEPSAVLSAMGVPPAEAKEHVRFSLGYETTGAEIDRAAEAVGEAATRLARRGEELAAGRRGEELAAGRRADDDRQLRARSGQTV